MNPYSRRRAGAPAAFRPPRGGFTILEVLVSMGIIVAALAGIAALLPAAGSRLADATEIDRAGTLAANARADLATRGLYTPALWAGPQPAVVFGAGLPVLATLSSATASIGPAADAAVTMRIDKSTGFQLPDDVQRRICYGCMLSATATAPPAAGTQVRATTVVFGNPAPQSREFTLTQTGSGSTVFTSGTGALGDADRKRFLAGCSWVVVVRSGTAPLWVPIASSWTTYLSGATSGPATGTAHVSLSGTDVLGYVTGTTLRAIGFEGLLRVEERLVTLE